MTAPVDADQCNRICNLGCVGLGINKMCERGCDRDTFCEVGCEEGLTGCNDDWNWNPVCVEECEQDCKEDPTFTLPSKVCERACVVCD